MTPYLDIDIRMICKICGTPKRLKIVRRLNGERKYAYSSFRAEDAEDSLVHMMQNTNDNFYLVGAWVPGTLDDPTIRFENMIIIVSASTIGVSSAYADHYQVPADQAFILGQIKLPRMEEKEEPDEVDDIPEEEGGCNMPFMDSLEDTSKLVDPI